MEWKFSEFRDPASHVCLAGAMVAFWSLTQEVAGSNPCDNKYLLYLLNSVKTFRENSIVGKNITDIVKSDSGKTGYWEWDNVCELLNFKTINFCDWRHSQSVLDCYRVLKPHIDPQDKCWSATSQTSRALCGKIWDALEISSFVLELSNKLRSPVHGVRNKHVQLRPFVFP